ncbi:hypothetical protein C5B86_03810 [Haloferax sp. Atlit-19N]|uniref:hypothetical protein n=1 Tax=Haloferax sp. Atlit-19N TaxID=2077201 RepID=UPI000E22D3EA|nr:hypothetical protein [Haloferax sp. Atlit-19N]RDZ48190.1 hypothetical protein C5B86_03810 [Haloferax sp. Atlit-19N]
MFELWGWPIPDTATPSVVFDNARVDEFRQRNVVQTLFDSCVIVVVRSLSLSFSPDEMLDESFHTHSRFVRVTEKVQDVTTTLFCDDVAKFSDSIRFLLRRRHVESGHLPAVLATGQSLSCLSLPGVYL